VLLAARGWGCTSAGSLELAGGLLEGYRRALGSGRPPSAPRPISRLLEGVAARKRRELLAHRTRGVGDRSRFRIGPTMLRLPRAVRAACARSFTRFAREEIGRSGHPPERFRVLDVAFRVAGTGSLGTFRVAVLVEGHGAPDGAWMFDLKAMGESAGLPFATRRTEPGPERVADAMKTMLRQPPTMLGTVQALGHGMLVRRLTPQEDRLDWATLTPEERGPTLGYLGALTAAAHRRGARRKPRGFDGGQARRILRSATELAGLHEAVALAYAAELRRA
jgi:uncharacterized protein (DUF2252 family)